MSGSGQRLRALAIGVALSFPAWGTAGYAVRAHQHALEGRADALARAAATQLRAVHTDAERRLGQTLATLCARDVGLERLLLERASGALSADDAGSSLAPLRRALGAPGLWLVEGRRVLARQGIPSGPQTLDPALLESATRRPVGLALGQGPPLLMRSCRATRAGHSLWLVHVRRADDDWLAGLGAVPDGVHVALQSGHAPPPAYQRFVSSVDALQIVDPTGAPLRYVTVRASAAEAELALAEIAWAAATLTTLALGLLLWRQLRNAQATEPALSALEQAATQIAAGDLTSTIGLQLEGRAGRTIAAFNRMTEELKATRAKLLQAERVAAWQDIAQRIAHELKNPLSPIQVAIETLRKTHARRHPDFEEIFEESTAAILEEVRRLERIVSEFRDFARLPRPRPGALDVGALVRQVAGLYDTGAVLECEVADGLPQVRADREQLSQVIGNLVQNALDAAATRERPAVHVSVRPAPERGVVIEVSDNGPGVPVEDRQRVLQPYFSTKRGGTGLGLAIAERIVKDHGGRLTVGDGPLGGALFRVALTPEGPPGSIGP